MLCRISTMLYRIYTKLCWIYTLLSPLYFAKNSISRKLCTKWFYKYVTNHASLRVCFVFIAKNSLSSISPCKNHFCSFHMTRCIKQTLIQALQGQSRQINIYWDHKEHNVTIRIIPELLKPYGTIPYKTNQDHRDKLGPLRTNQNSMG